MDTCITLDYLLFEEKFFRLIQLKILMTNIFSSPVVPLLTVRKERVKSNRTFVFYLLDLPLAPSSFWQARWVKYIQFFPSSQRISFSISYQLFSLFLMSSSSWLSHLILGRPICILPLNIDSKVFLNMFIRLPLSRHITNPLTYKREENLE
jgi:hypothetical protein